MLSPGCLIIIIMLRSTRRMSVIRMANRRRSYSVMRGSCIGMVYDYVTDVVAGSKACIAGYSAVQAYIAAVWAYYRATHIENYI